MMFELVQCSIKWEFVAFKSVQFELFTFLLTSLINFAIFGNFSKMVQIKFCGPVGFKSITNCVDVVASFVRAIYTLGTINIRSTHNPEM